MNPAVFALLLAAGQSNHVPATAAANSNDLSLICRVDDWSAPPFVSSIDAARDRLSDEQRQWLQAFDKSLREKSRQRENGDIGVGEFDRFVEHSYNDAVRDHADLKPILESISARYSRTIGVDRLLTVNNERTLAEHEASKAAKPLVGKFIQLRYLKGLLTWQESMRKVVNSVQPDVTDPGSGLKPTLLTSDTTFTFTLARLQDGKESPRTIASIDRYTGELLLERFRSDSSLLYTLSGLCEKQMQPRF